MQHLIKILVIFVLVSFSGHEVVSQYSTSVLPVIKDVSTPALYKLSLWIRRPAWLGELYYLIDLDAPFTWKDCVVQQLPVPCGIEEGCLSPLSCDHNLCKEARSYTKPICPPLNITAKYGCRICAVTPLNPISNTCKLSQLTTDLVDFYVTNGHNPSYAGVYPPFGFEFKVSCAPSSLLRSFPKGVHGVAAFSWSSLAFPRQVHSANVADKFALCLPSSSSAPGVIFLGEGPFYFTPSPNLDLRTILSYTPMIRKTSKSLAYYIKINGVSVKGKRIPLKSKCVKLSTVVAYTTLRSDIYKALVTDFSKATKNIPRVNAVKPFSLCLRASAIGSIRTGFRVPSIDLETESGKVWMITGDNSMKRMGNGAACLAFIDGGKGVKDAIVMGTYQMENNFLLFDLGNQKLGFSSSLLTRRNSCSSFNFTELAI